jgi:2-polyprenyl-6-methoxyphenol hydroxylase-like FAD-dependent oxidoreductase
MPGLDDRENRFDTDVLIVGAGPAGLAAAIELGTRGIKCLLIEKHERAGAAPRAKTTNVRTRTHMRRWGIADRLAEASPFGIDYPSHMIYVTRLSGYELARIENGLNASPRRDDRYPEHAQWIPQYKTEAVLLEKAMSLAGVEVRYNTRFESAEQDADGVTIKIVGGDDEAQTLRARYLIGADGARSMVREAIGATMEGKFGLSHHYNIIFRAPGLADAHPHGPAAIYWQVSPDGFSAVGPMDDGDRWFFMPGGAAPGISMPKEEAASLIAQRTGINLPYDVISADSWTASAVLADRYSDGRIFIVGDAAHLHPPTGGYGMNMGISDSVDLGWKMAAVLQGWAGPDLLHSYDVERRTVARQVIDEAVANFAVFAERPSSAIEEATQEGDNIRQNLGQTLRATKRREFDSLGIVLGLCYCSPWIAEEEGEVTPMEAVHYEPSARPGCLAPHAWLPDGRSLYDLFGADFTLLVGLSADEGEVGKAQAQAQALGVPLEVARANSLDVAALYGANLSLIRPDQHVAWRGERWDGALAVAVARTAS